MTADVLSHQGGSFDDLPEVELRTVLAVPLTLPTGSTPPPAARPPRRPEARHRSTATGGRHRARSEPASGPWATVQVGLSAAVTVFVAVAVVLLLTEIFL